MPIGIIRYLFSVSNECFLTTLDLMLFVDTLALIEAKRFPPIVANENWQRYFNDRYSMFLVITLYILMFSLLIDPIAFFLEAMGLGRATMRIDERMLAMDIGRMS